MAKRKSTSTTASSSNKNTKQSKTEVEEVIDTQGVMDDAIIDVPPKFIGDPVPMEEAKRLWPARYDVKKKKKVVSKTSKGGNDSDDDITLARCHYTQAEVDGYNIFNLFDDAYVKGDEEEDYIGRIVEMFESDDGSLYFTAQWFYRAKDTVIQQVGYVIDKKRVFLSEIRNDNPLDCLVRKLHIARVELNMNSDAKMAAIPECDYYYDMKYLLPYSTFVKLPPEENKAGSEQSSIISNGIEEVVMSADKCEVGEVSEVMSQKQELTLLDLYAGCGAMSTGLCHGANISGVKLVTKWAVDNNINACQTLKLNHPETQVRHEKAEDFLELLKMWEKLCICFSLVKCSDPEKQYDPFTEDDSEGDEDNEEDEQEDEDGEVFEVENILEICYGDPKIIDKRALYFKVQWKNYGEDADSWEPIEGLSNCRKKIQSFVTEGYKSRMLPLPGDANVICGGPPCQGVSGFNRFRDKENPLNDEKNRQLEVYMEIVEFLRPKFVLMENVVDLIRFSGGFLGRYALARLIKMDYQVRLGLMAAGAYGLPQFRMRCFVWGACPSEKLPPFPLPTHDVVVRGNVPLQFEMNLVAHEELSEVQLEKKLLLDDAISDLPAVENNEQRDEMPYDTEPKTDFQRFIRMRKHELFGLPAESEPTEHLLYNHRPLELNPDDHERVCWVPKKKGANFRDFPGIRVGAKNVIEWDPDVPRVLLKSGSQLVPDYAMTYIEGRSLKPFGRLWWDETVPTVVTRAEPHNQAIIHPWQDRVLTIRENARLQGFPDYYKLMGKSVKDRYIQVGNAVAVPVARALGYALGLALEEGSCGDSPVIMLPQGFPNQRN